MQSFRELQGYVTNLCDIYEMDDFVVSQLLPRCAVLWDSHYVASWCVILPG